MCSVEIRFILEEIGKAEAAPYLVDYIKAPPDDDGMDVYSEWRKFRAALEALQKITKIDIPLDKSDKELCGLRNKIITEIKTGITSAVLVTN